MVALAPGSRRPEARLPWAWTQRFVATAPEEIRPAATRRSMPEARAGGKSAGKTLSAVAVVWLSVRLSQRNKFCLLKNKICCAKIMIYPFIGNTIF